MTTHRDAESAANDLTQLSSREQLSALMDSALPADQTRFLLRRLQHDAPLAECWERWRIAGEVMRGLAPARRLPQDFASRVSAALHGDAAAAPAVRAARMPAWLRWGGAAAMAASLAVVALMARQSATVDAPQPAQIAAAAPQPELPARVPAQPAPAIETASQLATAATAVAAVARPQRRAARTEAAARSAGTRDAAAEATAQVAALEPAVDAPQPDIVTRPWPRSVLPQYANGGLTVGLGERSGSASYNPFQAQALGGVLPMQAVAAPEQPAAASTEGSGRAGDPQP